MLPSDLVVDRGDQVDFAVHVPELVEQGAQGGLVQVQVGQCGPVVLGVVGEFAEPAA